MLKFFDEGGAVELATSVELLYLEELHYFPEDGAFHPDIPFHDLRSLKHLALKA